MESPGSSFAYSYDLAGNRTGVTVDGTPILTNTYDAADQVVGWTYDNAGNLTNDGTTSYSYDATNDLTGTTTGAQTNAYVYNGDGTLVSQNADGTTTNYTQDLAADQSQILAGTVGMTTTDYLYGQDTAPLAALTGGARTWYGIDGQGSVRQSLDDSGNILGVANYDPFGQIEAGASLIGPFGYTGELQDATTGQEYLRARWYQPGSGTLLGVDPLLDVTGQPYGYAYADPVNGSDPSGLGSCSWYDFSCLYNAAHTAAQQSSFGRGFYAGTTSLIRGVGTVAGAFGDSTVSCFNPFDQTNCRNQRAANAATAAYIYAHPGDAFRAALVAAVQPYSCTDTAYNLGYGLPQIFLSALGALGEGGTALGEAETAESALSKAADVLTAEAEEGVGLTTAGAGRAVETGGATDSGSATGTEGGAKAVGCGCFPGDTGVATPSGLRAIASLHVGDLVLAEDPTTGKVEPEPVQALIDDGVKPLMQVSMSDGSSLKVTTNHPFYVDASAVRGQAGWVQAGDLRVGDHVRTASGHDLVVTNLRYAVGTAHVYTLTVATDHDFFVGPGQVLVHNCALKPGVDIHNIPDPSVDLQGYVDGVKQRIGHLYDTEAGFNGHITQVRNQYRRLTNAIAQAVRAGDWTHYHALKQAQSQLLDALNSATRAAAKAGSKAAANFRGL